MRKKREKKKEVSVPVPKKLPSGSYYAQVMVDGKRISVTAPNEHDYYVQARAFKEGVLKAEKKPASVTLSQCLENYIEKRTAVLSPSTVHGYHTIAKTRFKAYHSADIHSIDYQRMVNDEAQKVSAKTVCNAWGFVRPALADYDISVSRITLPQKVKKQQPWLDADQIKLFCKAIEGYSCELGALLALHSLRKSELLCISKNSIRNGCIYVEGAKVRSDNGYVVKDTNKNDTSRRVIPVFIPRLLELVEASDAAPDEPLISMNGCRLYDRINEGCRRAGLPEVGIHGLRRSFASLCASHEMGIDEKTCMELGGWKNNNVMRQVYIALSEKDRQTDINKLKCFFTDEITDESEKALN